MGIRKEIKEAILNGHTYDFIVNNQHRLSKDELVMIAKELDYAAYSSLSESEYKEFNEQAVNGMEDDSFFEEEEND